MKKENKYQEALNYLDWHCNVEHKEQQELLQELVDKEALQELKDSLSLIERTTAPFNIL